MPSRTDHEASEEKPIVISSTAARAGTLNPRVMIILIVSLCLALVAMLAAWAYFYPFD